MNRPIRCGRLRTVSGQQSVEYFLYHAIAEINRHLPDKNLVPHLPQLAGDVPDPISRVSLAQTL